MEQCATVEEKGCSITQHTFFVKCDHYFLNICIAKASAGCIQSCLIHVTDADLTWTVFVRTLIFHLTWTQKIIWIIKDHIRSKAPYGKTFIITKQYVMILYFRVSQGCHSFFQSLYLPALCVNPVVTSQAPGLEGNPITPVEWCTEIWHAEKYEPDFFLSG